MDYFAEQVAEAIKSQPAEKLIVDLRRNGGGDSSVISPLLKTISASRLNAPGKLYVLVGTETFSSAILNTVDFAQQTQALFAGSVPAGSPSHYGEVHRFNLPDSGVLIKYSSKHFVRAGYEQAEFIPDILIEPTYADYASGRDVVMDYFLQAGN